MSYAVQLRELKEQKELLLELAGETVMQRCEGLVLCMGKSRMPPDRSEEIDKTS